MLIKLTPNCGPPKNWDNCKIGTLDRHTLEKPPSISWSVSGLCRLWGLLVINFRTEGRVFRDFWWLSWIMNSGWNDSGIFSVQWSSGEISAYKLTTQSLFKGWLKFSWFLTIWKNVLNLCLFNHDGVTFGTSDYQEPWRSSNYTLNSWLWNSPDHSLIQNLFKKPTNQSLDETGRHVHQSVSSTPQRVTVTKKSRRSAIAVNTDSVHIFDLFPPPQKKKKSLKHLWSFFTKSYVIRCNI